MAGEDGKLTKDPGEIHKAFTEAVSEKDSNSPAKHVGTLMVSATIGLLLVIALVAVWRGKRSKEDAVWRLIWVIGFSTVALIVLFAYIALTTVRVS